MEKLAQYFTERVQSLRQCIDIQCLMSSPLGTSLLLNLHSEIGELEKLMLELKNVVDERKKTLKTAEAMKNTILDMQEQMRTASEEMPPRLPAKSQSSQAQGVARLKKPLAKKLNYFESPMVNTLDDTTCPTFEQIRKNSPALFTSQIEYLTVEEFEAVPKYMKLRLKYEQMNQAIDELNKAMTAKSAVINNKSRQKDRDYKEFKAQETKDTKGFSFIVDKDILTLSRMKLDKNGRNVLIILRHCGRLREIRGNNLVRYVFL